MKQSTFLYNCQLRRSKIYLRIEHWLVADYPMTMLPRECLEDWCESVGWRLLQCYSSDGLVYRDYYEFRVERPRDEYISDTILKSCWAYEGRVWET